MNFLAEYEQAVDGRWIADVTGLPGVLVYGMTRDEAMSKAEVLALCALTEKSRIFMP